MHLQLYLQFLQLDAEAAAILQAALLTAHRALKQQLMEQPLRLVESDRSPEELQSMARLL